MSIPIQVGSTIINFPSSGQDPNWSPAVIQFAQAVAAILSSVSGAFDVPNQTFDISIYNPGTDIPIPALAFPITQVRAASVNYSCFRTTTTTTAYETGTLLAVFNPNNPPTQQWEFTTTKIGEAQITFSITDAGQVRFTSAILPGLNHTGKIAFAAQALLKT